MAARKGRGRPRRTSEPTSVGEAAAQVLEEGPREVATGFTRLFMGRPIVAETITLGTGGMIQRDASTPDVPPRARLRFTAWADFVHVKHKFLEDGGVEETLVLTIDTKTFEIGEVIEGPAKGTMPGQAALSEAETEAIEAANEGDAPEADPGAGDDGFLGLDDAFPAPSESEWTPDKIPHRHEGGTHAHEGGGKDHEHPEWGRRLWPGEGEESEDGEVEEGAAE